MSTNHNEKETVEEKTLPPNDPVYLVMEMPDTGKYEITCVGIPVSYTHLTLPTKA